MIGTRLSHYTITGRLGQGGMGEVYSARDERLGREVAIKVLPADFARDADRLRRFEQEARATSALNHPNILTIYEIGEQQGSWFIVTEMVEGITLRQRLTGKRLNLADALDVVLQIAAALRATHTAGIIHRDIKPENVMLRHDGIVKVLDFGLAKLTERSRNSEVGNQNEDAATLLQGEPDNPQSAIRNPQLTMPGTVMGTAHYMSPEQARGLEVDERSDIFSLGIVLYEMITGRQPFDGPTMTDVLVAILQGEPEPPGRDVPGLPAGLEESIMRALCKDCDQRYQTIVEMLADLRPLRQRLELADIETRTEILPAQSVSGRQGSISRPVRTHMAIDSLAVLPLGNASRDEELDYLSEGITEGIINSLSQLPKLRVVPRSIVFRYRGSDLDAQHIGEELEVRAVLTGRMRQLSDQLIIRVELSDIARQSQIWGEQYRRRLTDIFDLQEEIASEISDQLRLRLTGEEKKRLARRYTDNTDAWHLYLKGRYFTASKRTEEWIRKGIDHFQQAIDLDPNYALAFAGLADAYAFLASSTGGWQPREAYPKAIAATQKALALDETLAEAHCSLGFAQLLYNWNFAAAEREFRRAIELNPNYANAHDGYGFYLKATGQFEAALRACEQAARLDPLSLFATLSLGWAYYFGGRFAEAIERGLQVLEMDPNFAFAWKFLGMNYGQQGAHDAAIDALEKAVELAADVPDFKAHLGHAYGKAGARASAEAVLAQLERLAGEQYIPSYYFALIRTGMNESDRALSALEQAAAERSGFMAFLRVEPMMDPLRREPRFARLLEQISPV